MKKLVIAMVALAMGVAFAETKDEAVAKVRQKLDAAKTQQEKLSALGDLTRVYNRFRDRENVAKTGRERAKLAEEMLAATTNVTKRLELRAKVRDGLVDANKGAQNDEVRKWDAATAAEAKTAVEAQKGLPDAEFVKKIHPYHIFSALALDPAGHAAALAFADRIFAMDAKDKACFGAMRSIEGILRNTCSQSKVEQERLRCADYIRKMSEACLTVGDLNGWAKCKISQGERLFRANHDLAGARAAFQAVMAESKCEAKVREQADLWNEMIKD